MLARLPPLRKLFTAKGTAAGAGSAYNGFGLDGRGIYAAPGNPNTF